MDGAGSGLNADLVDDEHSETFARQEILETTMDDLKNTRLVMGRLSDLAGEDGVKLELNYGNSVYGKIISSNPEINTGENAVINFIVNGVSYERTTDANGRAIYGMYLSHVFFITLANYYLANIPLTGTQNALLIVVLSIIIFLSSWILIVITSKIPLIKKVCGYH